MSAYETQQKIDAAWDSVPLAWSALSLAWMGLMFSVCVIAIRYQFDGEIPDWLFVSAIFTAAASVAIGYFGSIPWIQAIKSLEQDEAQDVR